jgi:transposase-like protein
MADSEGEFSDWQTTRGTCQKCGGAALVRRQWDSHCGGFEDDQYRCNDCGDTFWVEGPDA